MTSLKVKKFYTDAQIPTRGSAMAAGYDLYSYEDRVLAPGDCILVDTGVGITVPPGTYGRVAPRSGVSKHKILINAGICDEDYTGIVKVMMQNIGTDLFVIKKGDRIAQLVLEKIVTPEVEVVEELTPTTRGAGGFGSTGV